MEINALLMDPKDNVVTCVAQVAAGSQVVYRRGTNCAPSPQKKPFPFATKSL